MDMEILERNFCALLSQIMRESEATGQPSGDSAGWWGGRVVKATGGPSSDCPGGTTRAVERRGPSGTGGGRGSTFSPPPTSGQRGRSSAARTSPSICRYCVPSGDGARAERRSKRRRRRWAERWRDG
uniref:Uncharacterized protein n=1 Tax=Oryza punctata TaxID=4537 RepID=A0A0E0L9P6_ORYPU